MLALCPSRARASALSAGAPRGLRQRPITIVHVTRQLPRTVCLSLQNDEIFPLIVDRISTGSRHTAPLVSTAIERPFAGNLTSVGGISWFVLRQKTAQPSVPRLKKPSRT